MAKFLLAADNFVYALLSKEVKWKEEPLEYSIFYLSDICWKCKNPVKQVYGSAIDVYEDSVKLYLTRQQSSPSSKNSFQTKNFENLALTQ